MSYDELVKGLREHAERFDYDGWIDTAIWFEQAADAIEQLDKDLERAKEWESFWEKEATEALKKFQVAVSSKPRWIPVTERLPEDMCNVLVTDGENVGMGWLDYYTRIDTGAVERDWFAPNTLVEENKITHWMPLTMPPKEEQI